MKKPIKTALLRDLEIQLSKEEISYSRMVEILNEKVIEYARECVKASLVRASENADYGIWQNDDEYLSESNIFVNRETIDNEDNIVLL